MKGEGEGRGKKSQKGLNLLYSTIHTSQGVFYLNYLTIVSHRAFLPDG